MKHFSKILYLIGIISLVIGFTFVGLAAYAEMTDLRIPGYIFIALSWPILIVAFAWDFRQTMMIRETAGDRYTLMSKNALFQEAERRGLNPEDGKMREYYLLILREEDERINKEGH